MGVTGMAGKATQLALVSGDKKDFSKIDLCKDLEERDKRQ